jgi:hypothetical protein
VGPSTPPATALRTAHCLLIGEAHVSIVFYFILKQMMVQSVRAIGGVGGLVW